MLGKFQQLILLITIILMIGFIIMLVWVFRQANKKKWPPTTQPCPDYWTILDNGNCKYRGNNGACPNTTELDFSPLSDCEKRQWATNYSDGKLYTGDNGAVDGHTFCQGSWGNIDNQNKNMSCVYGIDTTTNQEINCNAKDDNPTLNADGTITYHKNYSFYCTNSEVTLGRCGTVQWDGITYGNDPCN